MQALLKAKKTIRMYPENNPIYIKMVDDTYSKFAEFFSGADEFTLKISQYEIFFGGEQVYHNPDKDDNLALFLFKDGLRELSFKREMDRQELEEFLRIITIDFDREAVDDDIVTLLWERDFQNITYIADDVVLTDDENYESKAIREIKGKAPGAAEFSNAYRDALIAEEVGDKTIVNLTGSDLQLLSKEIDSDLLDKAPKLADVLIEIIYQSEDAAGHEEIQRFLETLIVYSIRHGDLRLAVEIIKRSTLVFEDRQTPEGIKKRLEHLPSVLSSEECVKYAGDIFESGIETDKEVMDEYIRLLNRSAIRHFMTVLGDLKSIAGRKVTIDILIYLGKKDIQTISRGLHDNRWYFVRNIIYILRHIGDKKAVEYLLSSAKHPDIRVRKEAIKALGDLRSPLALQSLKDALNDPEASVRTISARSLRNMGSETAKRLLIEKVSGKDFRGRDFEEKKEFFEVLSQWNDSDILDFMTRTLKKRSFFRRSKHDENRVCAAYALGLTKNKDVLPVLYKLKTTKNKGLREQVNTAIKRIEHAGQ